MHHAQIVEKLKAEYEKLPEARAMILYGSVARNEHTANSDIDLWLIKETDRFRRLHEVHDGILVERWESPLRYLNQLLEGGEPPVIHLFAEGKWLFAKDDIDVSSMQARARSLKAEGPVISEKPRDRILFTRSEMTDRLHDARDALDDPELFNFIVAESMDNLHLGLYERYGLWQVPRKKVLSTLDKNVPEVGRSLRHLLGTDPTRSRLRSFEFLVECMMDKDGGLLEGECVLVDRVIR